MLPSILLALGLVSCNVYADDPDCRQRQTLGGGYLSGIYQYEGYGLPLPGLLSDFLQPGKEFNLGDLQEAVNANPYLLVQAGSPIRISKAIFVPNDHTIEAVRVGYVAAVTLIVDQAPAFESGPDASNIDIMNFIIKGSSQGIIIGN